MDITNTDKANLQTLDGKIALASVLLEYPQTHCSVFHRFGPGIYIREAHYPKNTFIVGLEHVSEHINVLLKGRINVIDGEGQIVHMIAPYMFTAKPGSKLGYTLEDTVWQNIYATTETDVETLESTLFNMPQILKDHQEKLLSIEKPKHQKDRDDFLLVCEETGWTPEEVAIASSYTGDRIPYPDGVYCLCSGPSPIQGKGTFSTASISEGTTIAPMRLNGKRTPAGYSINHSTTPNTKAIIDSYGDMYLVAITNIRGMSGGCLDEEITLNYRQVMLINNLIRSN